MTLAEGNTKEIPWIHHFALSLFSFLLVQMETNSFHGSVNVMYNVAVAIADTQYLQQEMRCSFNVVICMNASEEFPLMLLFSR